MTLLQRVHATEELWAMLIPFVTPPEPHQFALWLKRFDDGIIEHAFWRAGSKFSPQRGQFEAENVYRYVTAVCLGEERLRKGNGTNGNHEHHEHNEQQHREHVSNNG